VNRKSIAIFLVISFTLAPLSTVAQERINCEPAPSNNTPTRLNVWGPGGLVSTGAAATSTRVYPITDAQGSVRFLTDSSGNVVTSYTYTPYGTATSTTASTNPYQYTSENSDSETNLTYLRARYYDPTTGRFISRDPVRGTLDNPITQNPYVYALDNPTTYSDPSGEFIPLLLLGWAAIELGLTIWDGYDTVRTVTDDCATAEDKALALSLFAVGLVAPGGGYGKADDVGRFLNEHISKALTKRGWTQGLINQTLGGDYVKTVPGLRDTRHLKTGGQLNDPATAYVRSDGSYIIVNDKTGDIVQISNRNDPFWKAPWDQ